MKKEIHPEGYQKVIFVDDSNGAKFLVPSTVKSEKTEKWEISSESHPFYTGKESVLDTAGRVEKFKARMAKAKK